MSLFLNLYSYNSLILSYIFIQYFKNQSKQKRRQWAFLSWSFLFLIFLYLALLEIQFIQFSLKFIPFGIFNRKSQFKLPKALAASQKINAVCFSLCCANISKYISNYLNYLLGKNPCWSLRKQQYKKLPCIFFLFYLLLFSFFLLSVLFDLSFLFLTPY